VSHLPVPLLTDDIAKRAALEPLVLEGLRALRSTLPERFAGTWRPGSGCVVSGYCQHRPAVDDLLQKNDCCYYGGELLGETITAPVARFIAAAGNLWVDLLDRVALAENDRAKLLGRIAELERELRQWETTAAGFRERAWKAEERLAERGEIVHVEVTPA